MNPGEAEEQLEIEKRKKDRSQAKRNFTRQANNLRSSIEKTALTETVEKRFQDLKHAWSTVQLKHDEYVSELSPDSQEEEETWIEGPNEMFCELERGTDVYLQSQQREETAAQKQERDKEARSNFEARKELEKAKLQESIKLVKSILEDTKLEDSEENLIALEEALKIMDAGLRECESVHHQYTATLKDEGAVVQEREWIMVIWTQCNKTRTESQVYVKTRKHSQTTPSALRLEPLKFSTFSGELRKYPKFKNDFKQFILPAYKPEQTAFVLKSYLSDHIKEEVEALEDLKDIWDRLDKKYGDEGKHVDAIMADIKGIPYCADTDVEQVLILINAVEKGHRDLTLLGRECEINNATIVSMIEERLPDELQKEWIKKATGEEREAISRNKFPALLKLLFQYRERIEYKHSLIRSDSSKEIIHLTNQPFTSKTRPRAHCWLHQINGDHPIWRCRLFQSKLPEERVELVKKHNACFACLEIGHNGNNCKRGFKCRHEGCNLPHHNLLHEAHASGIVFHGNWITSQTILQIQTIKCNDHTNREQNINVLWDGGSTISLITFEAARRLGLHGHRLKLEIAKVGGEISIIDSCRYTLHLIGEDGKNVPVTVMGIKAISSDICKISQADVEDVLTGIEHEKIKRPSSGDQVECLIGYDYAAYHPVRIRSSGHLLVLQNRFGLVVAGSRWEKAAVNNVECVQVHHVQSVVRDFFSIEGLGVQCNPKCGSCKCGKCHPGGKDMTLKEEREYKLIENNLTYLQKERKWEAAYPWIRDPEQLPNNRYAVHKKLEATEKHLMRNPRNAEMYSQQIHDMVERGASRRVSNEELDEYDGPIHYISHHAVLKPESKSTPCRIVFNSSANFHGHILNDYYAKGPDMLNSLLGVLLRFREDHVAVLGDISKMFHAIKTPLRDQMTHLYLWRDLQRNREPDTYAMTAVNMGDKPSATMAIATLKKTAELKIDEYPEASKTILYNSYMDDITDNVGSVEEAVARTKDIDDVLVAGGFKVKGWTISGVPKTAKDVEIYSNRVETSKEQESEVEKVLGLKWDNVADILLFDAIKQNQRVNELQKKSNSLVFTKREVLSVINGIYDPLGLVSPYTVKAKVLMRRLWAREEALSWDDPIPIHIKQDWNQFFDELQQLQKTTFPRSIKPDEAVGDPTLIIFSDASGQAYGAAAYARWKIKDGRFEGRLIASKNRVAPLKTVDIVRLELIGAVLGTRLRFFIEKEMGVNFKQVYHIVDSEIVKAMVAKDSYGFNTFAANRIGEIQQTTKQSEWYWIKGSLNIADWITRGKEPRDLDKGSAWQTGPTFLRERIEEWPIQSDTEVQEIPERSKVFVAIAETTETLASRIDIDRFSKLEHLRNTTARILRLYKRFRSYNRENNAGKGELNLTDRGSAETFWVMETQKTMLEAFQGGHYVKLCPKVKDGIIVVGGRTERWMEATWNKQEFILLPKKHRFSYLIAKSEHEQSGHLGEAATVSRIRSKYWIIGVRVIVKGLIGKCIDCKKKRKEMSRQIMANLPVERLKPSPPFANTSLDFFGPFAIRGEVQKRTRGKCFGVIMTCMTSRAVYVDISHDYSTDAFFMFYEDLLVFVVGQECSIVMLVLSWLLHQRN